MAVRDDFTAGEVLAAADLNDTFASKPPFAYGTATPSTTVEGFIFYDENVTPPAPKFWDGSAFQSFGGGKVLQVVRATDATNRTTTSTTATDVTGMSVTITPQRSTSAVMIIASFRARAETSANAYVRGNYSLTTSANVEMSGAQRIINGTEFFTYTGTGAFTTQQTIIGYATPATTSPVTYKLRFYSESNNITTAVENGGATGQMYAIEVAA